MSLISPDQVEGFFGGAGDDGAVTYLDDRAVEQTGIRDDRGEDLRFRRIFAQAEFLELRLFGSQEREGRNVEFLEQTFQRFFVERIDEVIDLVVIYAVLTEQRGQIAAGRSGGLFVNGYFLNHGIRISPNLPEVLRSGKSEAQWPRLRRWKGPRCCVSEYFRPKGTACAASSRCRCCTG